MAKHKYLVLFRNQPSPKAGSGPSPERMQEMFAAYNAWMEQFKDQILDVGAKLQSDGRVVTSSGVADGPFVEAKELVGGYMILSTDSYDGAVEVVRACPGLKGPGGSMEIRQLMGGM